MMCLFAMLAVQQYKNPDFGNTFGEKALFASGRLKAFKDGFDTCAAICKKESAFLQAIVYPEVMRYNELKDGIEAESLRTLYVQFGEEYANFSIGLFQMKPGFAQQTEELAEKYLGNEMNAQLGLGYSIAKKTGEALRRERVNRMLDKEWQLVYLTAFVLICDELYKHKKFNTPTKKLQWYATVYNSGYNRTDEWISKKIQEENFYLQKNMPGKKFRYAAIATWFYQSMAEGKLNQTTSL
ncbi:MAG: hypothetical protein SFU87_11025 [Chitinophagaceae bacterium]|nr:hypothetical protein [Chitinophagaceae bacterium]